MRLSLNDYSFSTILKKRKKCKHHILVDAKSNERKRKQWDYLNPFKMISSLNGIAAIWELERTRVLFTTETKMQIKHVCIASEVKHFGNKIIKWKLWFELSFTTNTAQVRPYYYAISFRWCSFEKLHNARLTFEF